MLSQFKTLLHSSVIHFNNTTSIYFKNPSERKSKIWHSKSIGYNVSKSR